MFRSAQLLLPAGFSGNGRGWPWLGDVRAVEFLHHIPWTPSGGSPCFPAPWHPDVVNGQPERFVGQTAPRLRVSRRPTSLAPRNWFRLQCILPASGKFAPAETLTRPPRFPPRSFAGRITFLHHAVRLGSITIGTSPAPACPACGWPETRRKAKRTVVVVATEG